MTFDFEKIWRDKEESRHELAARPIAEKLAMLEALRDNALMLRKAKPINEKSDNTQATENAT